MSARSTTGCTLSPSVNILGSCFPAWLICIVTGLVLALIVWRVLVATAIAPYLTPQQREQIVNLVRTFAYLSDDEEPKGNS
jgi:hypothetical protein